MTTPKQQTSGGFDLATVKQVIDRESEGITVHLRDATGERLTYGEGKPVTVTVAGAYSKHFARAKEAQRDRLLRKRQIHLTAEMQQKMEDEMLAACVLAWEGIENGGKPFPCTPENAMALVSGVPWFREQIAQAVNGHGDFFESA